MKARRRTNPWVPIVHEIKTCPIFTYNYIPDYREKSDRVVSIKSMLEPEASSVHVGPRIRGVKLYL